MADYQRIATDQSVIRSADGAYIPNDDANRDWQEYQNWLGDGGVPDPYVPAPDPPPTPEEEALFDHENRIRALEGQPPMPAPANFGAR